MSLISLIFRSFNWVCLLYEFMGWYEFISYSQKRFLMDSSFAFGKCFSLLPQFLGLVTEKKPVSRKKIGKGCINIHILAEIHNSTGGLPLM